MPMSFIAPFKKVDGLKENYDVKDVLEKLRDEKTLDDVWSVNGIENMSGWRIMREVSEYYEANEGFEPQCLVVKTDDVRVKFIGATKFQSMDLMQMRGEGKKRKVLWWYEFDKSTTRVKDRRSVKGFEFTCMPHGGKEELLAIVVCSEQEYDGLVEGLREAESLILKGMWIDASTQGMKQRQYFLVQELELTEEDINGVETLLPQISSWQELIPMRHVYTHKPLFDEVTSLAMMVSVFYTKRDSPVFNTVFFGPSMMGKTSVLKYLVERIYGGKIETATTSSGKAWLVSHKEGAPPSKFFTEKRCLLIDEMLKAVTTSSSSSHKSYAVDLKSFLQKHMQILDKSVTDGSSGVGNVQGRMRCSFVGTENDDDTLQRALARAEHMSPAAFRRIQIGYATRDASEIEEDADMFDANKDMDVYFYKKFGKTVFKDYRALLTMSRRFSETWSPKAKYYRIFQTQMRKWLAHVAIKGWLGFPFLVENKDGAIVSFQEQSNNLKVKLEDMSRMQAACNRACYIAAAIVRGWEVYEKKELFQPVEDREQVKLAKALALYFFKSKLTVLEKGMKELFDEENESKGSSFSRR